MQNCIICMPVYNILFAGIISYGWGQYGPVGNSLVQTGSSSDMFWFRHVLVQTVSGLLFAPVPDDAGASPRCLALACCPRLLHKLLEPSGSYMLIKYTYQMSSFPTVCVVSAARAKQRGDAPASSGSERSAAAREARHQGKK